MFLRALLTGCLAILLGAQPQAAPAAEPRLCTVEAIDGPEAFGWTAGAWEPLSEGQAVAIESKVSTNHETRVKITCGDGIVLTVGTGTEVNLETLAGRGDDVVLQLIDGIIGLFAPEGREGRFTVQTPLAIASVRSTEWLAEHAPADGSAVFVRAGRVDVAAGSGGRATLGPGEGVTIAPDGSAGEVKTWGEARIRRSTEALGFGWQ